MLFKSLLPLAYFALSAFALPLNKRSELQERQGFTFTAQNYADFQISDGVGGNAKAEAEAVFVAPFAGIDLATVPKASRDAVEAMRRAAEAAETDEFNPQIDAASGAAAAALKVGKIKNKVLKLTGILQVQKIDLAVAQAAGDDTSSILAKIEEETTKLNKNIATDVASAGKASQGVA